MLLHCWLDQTVLMGNNFARWYNVEYSKSIHEGIFYGISLPILLFFFVFLLRQQTPFRRASEMQFLLLQNSKNRTTLYIWLVRKVFLYCILFFVCKQNAQCIARIIHDTFMDTFQLVFLLMPYFSSQRKVHGNFALRHMIVFSNFEIKEMFWWNNFFCFLLFFVIKCITYSLGEEYWCSASPFDPQNCLFYFHCTLNFLNW